MKETTYNNLSLLCTLTIDKLYTCTLWIHFHLIKFLNWTIPIWWRRKRCMLVTDQGTKRNYHMLSNHLSAALRCVFFPCWQTYALSPRHMPSSERKISSASSGTFVFIITTLHSQLKWLLDEMRGCKTCQEEEKNYEKAGGGRVERSTACNRTNTGGVVFYSLQQIEAAEWDGATIWPQLRAMHCKSTKINGNNSTLDAHHYPDGVLGELHRPPNQEQTQRRQRAPCSDTTAHLDDFHWPVCVGNQCWGATLATVHRL